ncbi:leucine-rich repeat protein kinase family protein [Striga asiatica]|uniref:Leucine-rich repeat protein kinase family protein n=1 Tax=Striga asiatica TaxID=4170 RepID=A0A5A7Q0Z4_STRAF|nr:leucine-rich repeat protein kinase family protein [Striga asiatica]
MIAIPITHHCSQDSTFSITEYLFALYSFIPEKPSSGFLKFQTFCEGTLIGIKKMKFGVTVLVFFAALATARFSKCSTALSPDGFALLELKVSLNDTGNFLSDWNESDEFPCKWTGIACSGQDKRVITINLPLKRFQGTIPTTISKLDKLQRLSLRQNELHGIIPGEIFQCSELKALYLQANNLEGGIPSTIGNLTHLRKLDLSSNLLKGVIPSSLVRLTNLTYLNLSSNFLTGEIPSIGALARFGFTSFHGNHHLCGLQVDKPCKTSLGFPAVLPHPESDDTKDHKRSSRYVKGLVIGAMSMLGFAIILLLGFLLILLLTKKERAAKKYTEVKKLANQEPRAKLITFHGDLPYPSCELVEKIESLDEEDIVGAGGFGTVYRMVMNDCGTFAVKKIDRSREGSDQVFERELEILGSIKHINLVNLRDSLAEERLLNWNARLRVAVGSARGLAYLHHDCSPKIVHRDIKSSNILLDENFVPRVSDFGLAKLLVDDDSHVTTVVAGTFGYLAPEYLQRGRATVKSDVYSFGVLLLELEIGKRPTDPSFVQRGLNIVGWMNERLRENRLGVVLDKRCSDADFETVKLVVQIAARCTNANPDERPTMQQVLQMLEQDLMTSPYLSEFYESH